MASDFFNPDMELFVDHRVDWKRYFHYRRSAGQKLVLTTFIPTAAAVRASAAIAVPPMSAE